MKGGRFVVSLDFEKLWGLIDIDSYEDYKLNVAGVDTVFPRIIEMSDRYGIRLTVAMVGFLMCKDKKEMAEYSPERIPSYLNKSLQPYGAYQDTKVGENGDEDRLHYASDLISQIHHPHEIASHTFCHYYCMAPGQSRDEFAADLGAAVQVARSKGFYLNSIVFPRNECRPDYLSVCAKYGFKYYRGNQKNWAYREKSNKSDILRLCQRACRLIDAYIPVSGHNCHDLDKLYDGSMIDIRASRFLRPYSPSLRLLDRMKKMRILNDMTYAAKNNKLYHLWWHPHNFGIFQQENLSMLESIYKHYRFLNKKYQFQSVTFSDLGGEIIHERV